MLLLALQACTYDKLDVEVDCNEVLPDTVSFSKDILPIFEKNCSTSGCHSGAKPEANFNLESSKAYATLTKKGSGYIDTIDPKGSVLYSAMVSVTQPMPPTGRLDKCTLEMIERWMKQKAKNN